MKKRQCYGHNIHHFQHRQESGKAYKEVQDCQRTMKKLDTYRANPNATVDDVAVEIREIADIITEIELKEAPIDLSLALKLIDVINGK